MSIFSSFDVTVPAQWSERGPELGREELGLLPRGEVAALVDFVRDVDAEGTDRRGRGDLRLRRDGVGVVAVCAEPVAARTSRPKAPAATDLARRPSRALTVLTSRAIAM
jgi:hypothetical protein